MEKELDDVKEVAEAGRGTDNVLAHMSLGEVVIPRVFLDDPQVMELLQQIFQAGGADMNQYTVGHEANSINPETGYPEFGFGKIFKKIASIALPAAASFIPGIGPVVAAGLGAAGGALGGGGLKGALLGGALSGIGAGLAGNTTNALKGTLLGGLEKSISGGLSPIGKAISGGLSSLGDSVSGALGDIGDYTGLSDVYKSASGALSDIGGGISNTIGDAYNGSVLQGAFKSGGDVLNSIGINTSSDSLGAGLGASAGGGPSTYGTNIDLPWKNSVADIATSYSPSADFASYKLPSFDNVGSSNVITNAAKAAVSSPLTGVTEVAKTNYASPLASALLGTFTNNKAESQLLKQQQANKALFEPYLNFEFNPGDLTQDPGYQFNLAQGNQALDRQQLAKGGYFSGEALKEAQNFGQGLADNTYNTAFNRALQTNTAGLQGAGAMAGINDNIGNIKAGSTVNTGNLYSGALGSILGGDSFNNSGALMGGSTDFLTALQRMQLAKQLGLAA
jgi:hypothetical protein